MCWMEVGFWRVEGFWVGGGGVLAGERGVTVGVVVVIGTLDF